MRRAKSLRARDRPYLPAANPAGRLYLVIVNAAAGPNLPIADHIGNAMRRQNANRMGLTRRALRGLGVRVGKQILVRIFSHQRIHTYHILGQLAPNVLTPAEFFDMFRTW